MTEFEVGDRVKRVRDLYKDCPANEGTITEIRDGFIAIDGDYGWFAENYALDEEPVFGGTLASEADYVPQWPHNTKFEYDVANVFDAAERVLLKKHADYSGANIAQSPGGPLNGLRVRMWDKYARINNLIETGATPENESLRDSFLDMLNYSAIALLVIDGHWPGVE